jgi:hypothetical protein
MNNYKFSKKGILNLFNNISIEEKKKILEFNYDTLWKTLWSDTSGISNIIYYKNKKIYDKNIIENKQFIKDLLYQSRNCQDKDCILWSIPKGKKNFDKENSLIVSIREFIEETGCSINDISINFNFKKKYITDCFYKTIYFIAMYKNNFNIKLNFCNQEQLLEINNIKWMSLKDINNECQYLHPMLISAFNYVKNHDLIF